MEKKKKISDGLIIGIIIFVACAIIGIVTLLQNDDTTPTYQKSSKNVYSNTTNTTSYTQAERQRITIIDFSTMTKNEIQQWCKENNINSIFTEEYSESIEKNGFIRQSIQSGDYVYEGGNINIVYSLGKAPTLGEKNALKSAKSYLRSMSFSYNGLIKQLKYEGYTDEECTYAVDNCGADWNEQASKCAKSYINSMSFSRVELLKQLKYEGFTDEQAEYGVKAVGY